jgi:MFS family permease
MFLMFGALFGSWYFETLYMQHVLGFSPLEAGVAFLPQTLLIAAGAQVVSRLVSRVGPRPLILAGTLVAAAGLAWMAGITPSSSYVANLLGPFILIGLGMGLTVTPVAVAGTAGVAPAEAGLASGLLNTSRTVGASIGLAALATLAANRTSRALSAAPRPGHLQAALTDGYALAFAVAAVILLATAAVAMAVLPSLRRTPTPSTTELPVPVVLDEVVEVG